MPYALIGKAVVRGARWWVRRRYGRLLPSRRAALAAAAGVAAVGVAAVSLGRRGGSE